MSKLNKKRVLIKLRLPRTTARVPAIGIPVRLINSIPPFGVHGTKPVFVFIAVRPSFNVCNLFEDVIRK